MTEYSITPSGNMQDAVNRLRPGDVLILEDGIYTQPIQPGSGVAGRYDARITIKARNDGRVLLDGRGQHSRVIHLDYSKGNDYFEIIGINACGGVNYTIDASSTGNIFRRCIAWGQFQGDEGEQTWRMNGYSGLCVDCAVFGGRYCIGANQMGNNAPGDPITTFRRVFAMYTGAVESSPKASFIYWYNSDPVRYENCIGSWDCQNAPNSQGIFYCATADPYVHGEQQTELDSCIAYLKRTQKAPAAISGISAMGNRRITIDNCAVHIAPDHPATGLKAFDLRAKSTTQSGDADLYVKNCTGIGPASSIHADWQKDNVLLTDDPRAVSLWANDGEGACIDPTGFLPLPMNQRIKDACILMDIPVIDVTADLIEIFGPLPGNGGGGNPTPEPPSDDVTISASAPPALIATWSGSRTVKDWIGLCRVGAPDNAYIDWKYTSATQQPSDTVVAAGSCQFQAPSMSGSYEFRFYKNDELSSVAKSNPIEV